MTQPALRARKIVVVELRFGAAPAIKPGLRACRSDASLSAMWLDPTDGKMFGTPEEWEKMTREGDPLLMKAYLHPEQLTPEERKQVELKLLSFLGDYLPNADIEKIIHEPREQSSDTARVDAGRQVLEGKLALRELGALEQLHFRRALVNMQTGQMITEEDVAAARKQIRAKRKKSKAAKNKRGKKSS